MEIKPFEKRHIQQAAALALEAYRRERAFAGDLPENPCFPNLSPFAENGMGVAAFDHGEMAGFLCALPPFESAFRATKARGVFSPMGANAALAKGCAGIYAAMYQAAAEKWVKAGAVSHAICLYAHDEGLQRQFYHLGFGLRCVDAIRPMELIDCRPCHGYDFSEATRAQLPMIYPLETALDDHCRQSPFFMNRPSQTARQFIAEAESEHARFFVSMQNGDICAYSKISNMGETFAASGDGYRHITGAFCLPGHRGRGVYQNLLNHVISVLKAEGISRLGVDFESFNPSGGFWLKYFTPYTHGVVRRIDENILETIV